MSLETSFVGVLYKSTFGTVSNWNVFRFPLVTTSIVVGEFLLCGLNSCLPRDLDGN